MTTELSEDTRGRILEFVRPLSVGVDGSTTSGFVERRLAIARHLADLTRRREAGTEVDDGALFLLAAFAGLPERRQAGGGRTELLLAGLGVPREAVTALFRSLKRLDSPRTLEERLVHDAGLVETVGAYGVALAIGAAARERLTLAEAADEVVSRVEAARFATEAGRAMAAPRIELARRFAESLRAEATEFG